MSKSILILNRFLDFLINFLLNDLKVWLKDYITIPYDEQNSQEKLLKMSIMLVVVGNSLGILEKYIPQKEKPPWLAESVEA